MASAQTLLLLVAISANVTANLAFKKAVSVETIPTRTLMEILSEPWLWLGCIASFILLGSYLAAISRIQIDVAYAVVTTGALVMLSIIAPIIFGTPYSLLKFGGIFLSLSGIGLLLYSQTQP